MVNGAVNARLEALVPLELRGPLKSLHVEAIIDTGFDASLAIPLQTAVQMGLSQTAVGVARMADGSSCAYGIFLVDVEWDGAIRTVLAWGMGSECLLGMKFFREYELRIRVIEGGAVNITKS